MYVQVRDDALAFGIARMANLYYIEGRSQKEIGEIFGISPMQVSRLLKKGLKQGIIEIRIQPPVRSCQELEAELRRRFHLLDSIVVDTEGVEGTSGKSLIGRVGALYILNLLRPGTTLAVPWGSTLAEMVKYLPRISMPGLRVVQMVGGPARPLSEEHPYEVCRRIGDAFGAEVYLLDAPALVGSKEVRDILLKESGISRVLNLARSADYAVLGMGAVDTTSTFYRSGMISLGELSALAGRGAVIDVLGHYIDEDGVELPWTRSDCHVGLSLEELRRIPVVIALASGQQKAKGLNAALKAKLANVLITDKATAEKMVADDKAPSAK